LPVAFRRATGDLVLTGWQTSLQEKVTLDCQTMGNIMLTASQFGRCPALNETPVQA